MATRVALLIILLSGTSALSEDVPTCAVDGGKGCSETDMEHVETMEVGVSQFELMQKKMDQSAKMRRVSAVVPVAAATVVHAGKECSGDMDTNLGKAASSQECGDRCVEWLGHACKFFIFGKGGKLGNCWWEANCDALEDDQYDVYQVAQEAGAVATLTASSFEYEMIKSGSECTGPRDANLGKTASSQECGDRCIEIVGDRCKFFIFGTGNKLGNCWWEENCDVFENDQYEVYKVTEESGPEPYDLVGKNLHCNDDSVGKYLGLCGANTLAGCQIKCDQTPGCKYVSWVPSSSKWTSDYGNMYKECVTTSHTGRDVYVRKHTEPTSTTTSCGDVTTTKPKDGVLVAQVTCGTSTYMRLEKGQFSDVGCTPITDEATCVKAAAALKMDETAPRNAGTGADKPQGCYAAYWAKTDVPGWKLLFASKGKITSTMNHQHPICTK